MTKQHKQLINDERAARKMFNEDKNNVLLTNPYYMLTNVYQNPSMFVYEEEVCIFYFFLSYSFHFSFFWIIHLEF